MARVETQPPAEWLSLGKSLQLPEPVLSPVTCPSGTIMTQLPFGCED